MEVQYSNESQNTRRVDWIHPAQYRDQWRAILNVTELSVPIKRTEILDKLSGR